MVNYKDCVVCTSREIAKNCYTEVSVVSNMRKKLKLIEGLDFFHLAKQETELLKKSLTDEADKKRFSTIFGGIYLYTLSGQSKLMNYFLGDKIATSKEMKPTEPQKAEVSTLTVVEHKDQRVLTTEQLAAVYGCTPQNITQNFNNNVERFREGEHYFRLEGTELKAFKREVENFDVVKGNVNTLYLWTERGARRHCKMLNTTMAWNVFDELEESYFTQRRQETGPMDKFDFLVESAKAIRDHEKRMAWLEKENTARIEQERILKSRMDTLNCVTPEGTPRQKLGAMVKKYANLMGIQYATAWGVFVSKYNTAYRTNLKLLITQYTNKGNKRPTTPEFLEITNKCYDAMRVVDKMLQETGDTVDDLIDVKHKDNEHDEH